MSQSGRTSFLADAAAPAQAREGRHPATFAPATLILIVVLSVVGVQLIVQLGVTPNTSMAHDPLTRRGAGPTPCSGAARF